MSSSTGAGEHSSNILSSKQSGSSSGLFSAGVSVGGSVGGPGGFASFSVVDVSEKVEDKSKINS